MDEVARAALRVKMSETAYLQELADLFLYLTDDLDENKYDDAKKMARDILKGGASTDPLENRRFYLHVHEFFSEYPQVSTVIGFTLIQLKNTLLGDGVVKSAVNKMIEQSAGGENSTTKSEFWKQSEEQRQSKLLKCLNDIRNEIVGCQAFVVTKMGAIFRDKDAGRNPIFHKIEQFTLLVSQFKRLAYFFEGYVAYSGKYEDRQKKISELSTTFEQILQKLQELLNEDSPDQRQTRYWRIIEETLDPMTWQGVQDEVQSIPQPTLNNEDYVRIIGTGLDRDDPFEVWCDLRLGLRNSPPTTKLATVLQFAGKPTLEGVLVVYAVCKGVARFWSAEQDVSKTEKAAKLILRLVSSSEQSFVTNLSSTINAIRQLAQPREKKLTVAEMTQYAWWIYTVVQTFRLFSTIIRNAVKKSTSRNKLQKLLILSQDSAEQNLQNLQNMAQRTLE